MCSESASSSPYVDNILNTIQLSRNWQVDWFTGLAAAKAYWEHLPASNNLFLTTDYFQLMEQLDLSGLSNGFAIFRHQDGVVFGLVLQVFQFNPEEQMGKLDQGADLDFGKKMAARTRGVLAKILRFNILSAGQMLLTGDHAIRGRAPEDQASRTALINEGMEAIARQWPLKIHAVMLKDILLSEHPQDYGYAPLPVQPNMVLQLDESWCDFDDYLGAMSSKYRVRARRARKKGQELERREMQLEELVSRQQQMFAYYQDIARQSDFNTIVLPPNYFIEWKKQFSSRFRVWGYFQGDNFIGFATAIYNDHELEAHFLGFDQSYNGSHQLYLNMLYDLVEEAIVANSNQLIFSRTALEIKSSVGATPEALQCWVRSRISIARPLLPIVARFIAPLPDWVQRHPFK
jgi:hypothetical protein